MFDKREPERTELSKELAALEQQLSAMTPAAPRIDRDKLMFAAGQAAVSRPRWPVDVISRPRWPGYIAGPSWAGSSFWPAATAMMTAATLLLATVLVWQRHSMLVAPQIATIQAVDHPRDTSAQPAVHMAIATDNWATKRPPTAGYLGIRYIALTQGVGALAPDYSAASASGNSPADLQQSAPATARDLMEELLPTSARMANPRS